MNIDWNQGDGWVPVATSGIHSNYGSVHVYAMTMTIGMIVAILFSLYKFWKKGYPLDSLLIAVVFIIPMGLFGGSVFGKLNADGPGVNADGVGFWGLFAFWKAGMAIHGAIYVGLLTGIIVLSFGGRKNKVSILGFADAILPHVLLAQAIGRWGNFFNHEVMGAPVAKIGHTSGWLTNGEGFVNYDSISSSITGDSHLSVPQWILNNTMSVYTGPDTTINGIHYTYGDIVQLSPIFFYESMAFIFGWLLLVVIVPWIFKFINASKLKSNEDFSLKASFRHVMTPWKKDLPELTYDQAWDKEFVRAVDENAKAQFVKTMDEIKTTGRNKFIQRWLIGNEMIKANNPKRYSVLKVGFEAGGYFFIWNLVRLFMELSRPDDHLFIMYDKPLSLALISVSMVIGLLVMVFSQWGIPQLTRKPGYLYEKEYFTFENTTSESVKITQLKKPTKVTEQKHDIKKRKAEQKLAKLEK